MAALRVNVTCRWLREGKRVGAMWIYFLYPLYADRLVIMMFCWFTAEMVHYALCLDTCDFGADLYLSTFTNAFAEFLAYIMLVFVINKFGRRTFICSSFLASGGCCVLSTFVLGSTIQDADSKSFLHGIGLGSKKGVFHRIASPTKDLPKFVLALIGKFRIAATFALVCVYIGELFPMVVRRAALSFASLAPEIGGVASP